MDRWSRDNELGRNVLRLIDRFKINASLPVEILLALGGYTLSDPADLKQHDTA